MSESPLIMILLFAAAVYIAKLWRDDYLAGIKGSPNPKALPGATTVPSAAIWIGVVVAVLLVLVETAGELALGVSAEQTDITVLFLLPMIGAGIIEELVFRGYLVIKSKGRNMLILSIVGFSLIFTLLHYQYYAEIETLEEGRQLTLKLDEKALWSLSMLFINSLWFYSLRFFKWNPNQSLLPCFLAHISSNVAVFLVKLAQGHVTGLW
jgi:membrane protease YdiL (CAAX protease family)